MSVDSAVEDCRKRQLSKTIGNPIIRHRSKSAKIETPPRYRYGKMRNKIQQKKKETKTAEGQAEKLQRRGKWWSVDGRYGNGQIRLNWRRVVDRDVVDEVRCNVGGRD